MLPATTKRRPTMAEPINSVELTPEEIAKAEAEVLRGKIELLEADNKKLQEKRKPPSTQEKADAKALLDRCNQLEAENTELRERGAAKVSCEACCPAPAVDPDEEYITVELFYDGDKYKDDVFVSVNGQNCLIQRGKPVKIKRKFANIIRSSDLQDRHVREIIQGLEKDFKEASKALG